MAEAYHIVYKVHLGSTKMYNDLKVCYRWNRMKNDVTGELLQGKWWTPKPSELLQPLLILKWKWEIIIIDFVTGLLKSHKGYDSIWVIVVKLIKSTHFLLVKITYGYVKLVEFFISKIVQLHRVPILIVSDWGPWFMTQSKDWCLIPNAKVSK